MFNVGTQGFEPAARRQGLGGLGVSAAQRGDSGSASAARHAAARSRQERAGDSRPGAVDTCAIADTEEEELRQSLLPAYVVLVLLHSDFVPTGPDSVRHREQAWTSTHV